MNRVLGVLGTEGKLKQARVMLQVGGCLKLPRLFLL